MWKVNGLTVCDWVKQDLIRKMTVEITLVVLTGNPIPDDNKE